MLRADITIQPVPGAPPQPPQPSTPTTASFHHPNTHPTGSTTAATLTRTPSSPTTQRFYRFKTNDDRPPTPPPSIPATALVSTSSSTPSAQLLLLESTRRTALYTLTLCRNVIAILELTRLRKSRIGLLHWIEFWHQYYGQRFGRALAAHVTHALGRIDSLFRAVASDLHQLTQRVHDAVAAATSEVEILRLLERMEDEVGVRRRRRRKKAQSTIRRMRANLEAIPVQVSDDLLDDLKRGVFALDVYCDYYPGDESNSSTVARSGAVGTSSSSSSSSSGSSRGSGGGMGQYGGGDWGWTNTTYLARRPVSSLALSAQQLHHYRNGWSSSGSAADGAWMALSMPVHQEEDGRRPEQRRRSSPRRHSHSHPHPDS